MACRAANAVALILTIATVAGCQSPGRGSSLPTNRIDRLVLAYPDIETGRLVVIADFEEPQHGELFHLQANSSASKIEVAKRGGRKQTGSSCLIFRSGSPSDAVVIDNSKASKWYLKRDWNSYDLLLLSVYAPGGSLSLELTASSGAPQTRLAADTSIPLSEGWNTIRLDLADLGERIALDDVQEIRLSVSGSSKPVEVRFDDILLTSSREVLLGDPEEESGGLYLQRVGQRWRVGARCENSGFELTFANGQITAWYNLAADPYRLHNLVRGTTLGPAPVTSSKSKSSGTASRWSDLAVAVETRIVEINEVRVVVLCTWRFREDGSAVIGGSDSVGSYQWRYTIYPSGQVYVAFETSAINNGATDSWIEMAATVTASKDEDVTTFSNAMRRASDGPAYALVRNSSRDALLLYAPNQCDGPVRTSHLNDGDNRPAQSTQRTSLVARVPQGAGRGSTSAHHLLLGSASMISNVEARLRALDFTNPRIPKLELGTFAKSKDGLSSIKGYDPASGCFKIIPDGKHVRFRVGDSKRPCFDPVFEIVNPDRLNVWVYVNHLIFKDVARSASGNLIFQIPGTVRESTLIEIVTPP